MRTPKHQIRATYDAETITVYQAYSPAIADPAVAAGTFVPPFSLTRMTWIKPSFLWMMYRCGWASKSGQERVLAIRITRGGFESALSQACLSHFNRDHHADHDAWRDALRRSPVRIQWDPEAPPPASHSPTAHYRSASAPVSSRHTSTTGSSASTTSPPNCPPSARANSGIPPRGPTPCLPRSQRASAHRRIGLNRVDLDRSAEPRPLVAPLHSEAADEGLTTGSWPPSGQTRAGSDRSSVQAPRRTASSFQVRYPRSGLGETPRPAPGRESQEGSSAAPGHYRT